MPKYLFTVRYTPEGAKGLLKDGGTKRKQVAEQVFKAVGGKLECVYFTYGPDDGIGIVDLPDAASATAISLIENASGGLRTSFMPLITAEEMDLAAKKASTIPFRAPGQ